MFAFSVFAIDIDNDGDIDLISASASDDKIAWYENIDGKGTFGPQQIVTTDADFAVSVFAIDIDNDNMRYCVNKVIRSKPIAALLTHGEEEIFDTSCTNNSNRRQNIT